MPKYEYRCKQCGSVYESETPADQAECWTEGCEGPARRVWSANMNISHLKSARS